MSSRLSVLLFSLPLLAGAALAQAGDGARMFEGAPFYAQYIVDYWRQPPAMASADPSRRTPGWTVDKTHTGGGPTTGPGVAEIRAKLDRLQGELLRHPLLRDPQGFSMTVSGAMGPARGGPMPVPATGAIAVGAYPLHLDDPATRRRPDGRYHTPGEASFLEVRVNELDDLDGRQPVGRWNDIALVNRGDGYMLVLNNSGRPLFLANPPYGYQLNPQLLDPSRPAGQIQFLTARVSSQWRGMPQQQLDPASSLGRMIGVLFLTDWKALLRQVEPSMR
jgi:hypothetical protein